MSTEANKQIVRRYFDEFHSQRALALADEILGPDVREPTLGLARMLTTAFPDYTLTIVDQVAEGDKVATVWQARGTHQGEWMSPLGAIPPSGKSVTWTGTTTLRISDGKIADVIGSNWDHLGILQQVDALPATAPRAGA
jgi:predicted ester cyclase